MERQAAVPERPEGKARAYLDGSLPPGYHGVAERTVRDALKHSRRVDGNIEFDPSKRQIRIYNGSSDPLIVPFSEVVGDLHIYFDFLHKRK